MEMIKEPEFWVAVAFFILMGVFAYLGVHRTVLKTLDHRSERIKAELDERLAAGPLAGRAVVKEVSCLGRCDRAPAA